MAPTKPDIGLPGATRPLSESPAAEASLPATDPRIAEKVGHAICISGIARSGTTVMGKLLHSLKNVEYAFEPQPLVPLLLLIDRLPPDIWRLLYQTYLFDEVLMNALAGRYLNFNPKDDSYIYRAKTEQEIAQRFQSSHRYKELFDLALTRTIAFKVPNILPAIAKLESLYPDTRFLVMLRHPDAVVLSLKRKGWFRRAVPEHAETGLLKTVGGHVLPALVADEDAEAWIGLSETDRCYHFYTRLHRHFPQGRETVVVDYDRFVDHAPEVFAKIAVRLDLEFGEKTAALLAEVAHPHVGYPVPEDASCTLREEAIESYQSCRQRTLS